MAHVEFQLREPVFFELLRAELLRSHQLYAIATEAVAQLGALAANFGGETPLFDRIEIPDIAEERGEPDLRRPLRPGELLLRLRIEGHLTTFSMAQAAGHLAQPSTTAFPMTALVGVSFSALLDKIRYEVIGGDLELQGDGELPFGVLPPLEAMGLSTAMFLRDGVLVILALIAFLPWGPDAISMTGQEQQLKEDWRGPRLEGGDWTLRINGELFANSVSEQLNRTVDQLAAAATDPEIEIEERARPLWVSPAASSRVVLNAVDAVLIFDASAIVSVRLALSVPPGPWALNMTLRMEWRADDLLTDLGFNVVQDQLNAVMAAQIGAPSQAYVLTASGSDFSEYGRQIPFAPPHSRAAKGTISSLKVDGEGVVASGRLLVRRRPTGDWTTWAPTWQLAGNCSSPSVQPALHGPSVQVVVEDAAFPLFETREPVPSHLMIWSPVARASWPGVYPLSITTEFRPMNAPQLAGQGVATSACVCTSIGVRWVDFGTVPARPDPSDPALLVYRARLIANCIAVSERWRTGILPLDFGVDPLPDPVDIAPMQEWLVLARGVRGVETVVFTLIGPNGRARRVGEASVDGGLLRIRALSAADEWLHLEAKGEIHGPPPRLFHRWIQPRRVGDPDDPEVAELLEGVEEQYALVEASPTPPGAGSLLGVYNGRIVFATAGPFRPLPGLSAAAYQIAASTLGPESAATTS